MFKSWKFKLFFPIFLFCLGIAAKYIFFEYPVSQGKIKGIVLEVVEAGTILEAYKVQIEHTNPKVKTNNFSIISKSMAKEIELFIGKEVEIQFEENILHLFRPSNFFIQHWTPTSIAQAGTQILNQAHHDDIEDNGMGEFNVEKAELIDKMEVTLFCSTLGSLYQDADLYQKVKEHLKKTNIYIYQQIDRCNN